MLQGESPTRAYWRDRWSITLLALLLRAAVVNWGAHRFPPAGDGQYYQVVAGRIARGLGYTWLWPDGAVTYAAHYPIGYPAILGGLYAAFGARPALAMLLNAVAGTAIVWSVHRIASRFTSRWGAGIAAGLAAVHPTLLLYTPAMMTELVSAGVCIFATALAFERPKSRSGRWLLPVAVAVLMGAATLIRPQQLLFAPLLGFLYGIYGLKAHDDLVPRTCKGDCVRAFAIGGAVACLSVAVCLPWTLRNCHRMGQCVFVSANAGWNLLIGTTEKGHGAWTSIDSVGVPADCRLVFAEAAKDTCFGQAARKLIRNDPMAWIRLVPSKLERTFDDVGAPGWYLNTSDWHHFDDRAKVGLGTAEVLFQRLTMLATLVGLARIRGSGRTIRLALATVALGCLFFAYAWLGVLLLCLGVASIGRRLLDEPILMCLGFAYGTTAAVHAVFFGGARYSIVVMPFMLLGVARAWSAGREPLRPGAAV